MMRTVKDIDKIADGLAEFFAKEPRKIALWLLTENPNFGGCSPAQLIVIRDDVGMRKVARFIETSIDENKVDAPRAKD